jgi:hypothetical protein
MPITAAAAAVPFRTARRELLVEFERVYLLELLERHGSDLKAAAREAGLPLRRFTALVRKHTRPYVLARVRAFYGSALPSADARRIADQLLQLELTTP